MQAGMLLRRARELLGPPDVLVLCRAGKEAVEEEDPGILSPALIARAFLPTFVARKVCGLPAKRSMMTRCRQSELNHGVKLDHEL